MVYSSYQFCITIIISLSCNWMDECDFQLDDTHKFAVLEVFGIQSWSHCHIHYVVYVSNSTNSFHYLGYVHNSTNNL